MASHSEALLDRAKRVLVDGGSSASRGPRVFSPYPPYIRRAEGCRLYDVDGQNYIDWMVSFGALSLGHAHPAVVSAVNAAVSTGAHFAAATPEEVDLAELICDMVPVAEKVRFANSGTEAVMAAVRLARGFTGRKKVLKFEGHYHGWHDSLLVTTNPQPVTTLGHPHDPVGIVDSSGIPQGCVEDTIVVPWNDPAILARVMRDRGREIACVVTEGVMANIGIIPPRDGYLETLQTLCREYGALFYLDETVTGFRMAPGGCAEVFGLEPDLVSFGKALGQGFPLAAVCGRSEIMNGLEWGKVMHFGTFNACRALVAASKAGLETMRSDDNAGFKTIDARGSQLGDGIKDAIQRQNRHRAICQNVGSLLQIYFTDKPEIEDFREYCRYVDPAKFARFANLLRREGVYMNPSNTLHNASCIAHSEKDVEDTISAIARTLERLDA